MIAYWLIDQLVQQGVRHFCIAPGSRSTPLVVAASGQRKAKIYVHYDERGLGFFALGIAKAKNIPVAVIVTSGTAVGNLLPSIMESYHCHTPLILLTADRPHELRDCGANQATDQVKIFQSFVYDQTDLSLDLEEKVVRSIAAHCYFLAKQGPIHINCPFRKPLYDPKEVREGKAIACTYPTLQIDSYKSEKAKGVIVIGKLPHPNDIHPILALATRLKWPVLADILSNARNFPTLEQIKYFDWIETPTPEFVLHFGERLTSDIQLKGSEYIHVSPYMELQDPARVLTARVQADIFAFCKVFQANSDPSWLVSWVDEEPEFEERGVFTEVHAMREIGKILPAEFGVFLGNGMPIRDADHFLFPKSCRGFFANRGLSGIDGNIATIAGLAEEMPILGFIGDQAALYDLNSLPLLKKTKYKVVLIISNNFGGGIFHHLPVVNDPNFETLWASHHDLRFEWAAKMFGIPYVSFDQLAFHQTMLVELITDRKENYDYHVMCKEKNSPLQTYSGGCTEYLAQKTLRDSSIAQKTLRDSSIPQYNQDER